MKIAVVYIYPMVAINKHFALAKRFAETLTANPASIPFELHVIANGAPSTPQDRYPFRNLSPQWHAYDNRGWDIGAFQWAGENIPSDLMVCMGSPIHFYRGGWLERMAEAYVMNGPGMYGCWAYNTPALHIRTTCFWLPRELLNAYPDDVGSRRPERYEFEHGSKSMTRFTIQNGLGCYMVSTDSVFTQEQWDNHCPDLNNSLVYDQHIHR